jgi:hypothetical protein
VPNYLADLSPEEAWLPSRVALNHLTADWPRIYGELVVPRAHSSWTRPSGLARKKQSNGC